MTAKRSHPMPIRYSAFFLFITKPSPYEETISISRGQEFTKGTAAGTDMAAVTQDDLPKVGEIVKVAGSNSYWTVAGVLRPVSDTREAQAAAERFSEVIKSPLALFSVTLLLVEQTVPLNAENPYLYVGWEDCLVGAIGADRVFRVLSPAGRAYRFGWGYVGNGPLSLAESILVHHTGAPVDGDLALAYCKAEIARLPKDEPFVLRAVEIACWLRSRAEGEEVPEQE